MTWDANKESNLASAYIYICVCVCVCVCVCMYVCMYACMYVCNIYVYVCMDRGYMYMWDVLIFTHTHTRRCMHACTCTNTHIQAHAHTCTCTCKVLEETARKKNISSRKPMICRRTSLFSHKHAHACTHIHTYTLTHASRQKLIWGRRSVICSRAWVIAEPFDNANKEPCFVVDAGKVRLTIFLQCFQSNGLAQCLECINAFFV